VLLGSGAAMLMRVEPDADTGSMVTVAGAPYAAVWIVVAIARLMFTYESTHSISFGRALGTFLINNQISVTALASRRDHFRGIRDDGCQPSSPPDPLPPGGDSRSRRFEPSYPRGGSRRR